MLTRTPLTIGPQALAGELCLLDDARGLVLFVHGSGSSHRSTRNQRIALALQQQNLATCLVDLLTPAEAADEAIAHDLDLITARVAQAIDALPPAAAALPLGLFGSGTGAAAALVVAAQRPQQVRAVVSRGGRTDLAAPVLSDVRAPTLLIVGGADPAVLRLNREALAQLRGVKAIEAVPRATHLFLEAGTLEAAALRAGEWFRTHLPAAAHP
jgi:putative phosphoribosyl transferase